MRKYKAAVAQINTGEKKDDNFVIIENMILQAAKNDAKIICFPEMANVRIGEQSKKEVAESLEGPTVTFFKRMAAENHIWVCCGSFFEQIPGSDKVYNTSLLIDDKGDKKAVYRKRHLFDVDLEDGKHFRESDTVEAGEKIVSIDTDLGQIGFGICYDLRFPEHFREMALSGMQVLLLPASFVHDTGMAHWESLLRARAIENGCYVLASDQCGQRQSHITHGHSMIISPWGEILAKADMEEELLFAEIDLDYVEKVRSQIPSSTFSL